MTEIKITCPKFPNEKTPDGKTDDHKKFHNIMVDAFARNAAIGFHTSPNNMRVLLDNLENPDFIHRINEDISGMFWKVIETVHSGKLRYKGCWSILTHYHDLYYALLKENFPTCEIEVNEETEHYNSFYIIDIKINPANTQLSIEQIKKHKSHINIHKERWKYLIDENNIETQRIRNENNIEIQSVRHGSDEEFNSTDVRI